MPEHLSRPMIITVRGHPSSSNGRSAIATKLASHLKYTLMDQDDVAKTLQDSFPSSSPAAQNLSELSFKLLRQIASAQVGSNLGVIINSPHLKHPHLDQLKQLVSSRGGELILIQCRPPDEIDDYDVAGVRKLTVDTSEPFDVKEFVAEHLWLRPSAAQAIALQAKMEKPNIPRGKLAKTPSLRPPRKVIERIPRHLHALTLLNKPKNEGGVLYCKHCQESISGPCYQCRDCDEYIFDKSCAETPSNLEFIRRNCPDYLKATEPKEYGFRETQKCNMCEENKGFSRDCHDCLFQTTMKGQFLPIVVNHDSHAHPLNLIIMPISLNYEYGCCGCGEFGKSISYRCHGCNFNLHVRCVLLPPTACSPHHPLHVLTLAYDALDHNYWEKSYCVVCRKETNPEQWFYSCSLCNIVIHTGCANAADVLP